MDKQKATLDSKVQKNLTREELIAQSVMFIIAGFVLCFFYSLDFRHLDLIPQRMQHNIAYMNWQIANKSKIKLLKKLNNVLIARYMIKKYVGGPKDMGTYQDQQCGGGISPSLLSHQKKLEELSHRPAIE